jgi:hypothetical protein
MRCPFSSARSSLRTVLLTALLMGFSYPVLASPTATIQESWTMTVGSICEILADAGASDVQFSWVLTGPDGSFLQANRGALFRERFVEAGDYMLIGEAYKPNQSLMNRRSFGIHVVLPPESEPTIEGGLLTSDGSAPFMRADAADTDGSIALTPSRETLLLTPLSGGNGLFSLDLDLQRDSDGDGDPANDHDERGTFFESDGTPLRIWFADPAESRSLLVRHTVEGREVTSSISVAASSAGNAPIVSTAGIIQAEDRGNGTYAFSVRPGAITTTDSLLFLWDFGDGSQSLLDQPVHRFSWDATFVVTMRARDLRTTKETLSDTLSLIVSGTTATPPPSSASSKSSKSVVPSSSSPSTSSSSSTSEAGTPGAPIGLLLKIIIVLFLFVLLGLTAMYVVARHFAKKKGLLGNGNEKTKASPQGKAGPSAPSLEHAPPMAVIDAFVEHEEPLPPKGAKASEETHVDEGTTKPLHEPLSPKLSEVTFNESEAPSWLKQAQGMAKESGQTIETPPPATLLETPSTAETPKAPPTPAGTTPPPSEEPLENAAVPTWLSPPKPEPLPMVAPPPPPPPPPSGGSGEPRKDTTPDWLKETPPSLETTPPPPPPRKPAPAGPPVSVATSAVPPAPSPAEAKKPSPAPPATEKKDLTPQERERRRRKRQRYKANKKKREQEEKTKGAVAAMPAKPMEAPPAKEDTKPKIPPPTQEKELAPPASPPPPPGAPAKEAPPAAEPTDETIAIIRADNISPPPTAPKKP